MRDHDDAVNGNQPLEAHEKHEDANSHVAQTISLIQDVSFTPMYRMQQQDLSMENQDLSTTFRLSDGSNKRILLKDNFRDNYKDEYTQESLPSEWVQQAIHDELDFLNQKVWIGTPMSVAMADPGAKIIGTRWIINNKGDANEPDVRARLVAQEVAQHGDMSFFAATPPLESKRMLFSQYSTERSRRGQALKLSFIDVRKAYFHGVPSRKIYVKLPSEMGCGKDMVGKLENASMDAGTPARFGRASMATLCVQWASSRGLRPPAVSIIPRGTSPWSSTGTISRRWELQLGWTPMSMPWRITSTLN